MSRISKRFQICREAGRAALIPYITGGDPSPHKTVELMHGLVAGGADILEIGVPFSDPMADGPVIQAACARALQAGTTPRDLFVAVEQFRRDDLETPVVFMGYANTLEAAGYQNYVEQAAAAGVDGLLTVDLPPDEAGGLTAIAAANGIELIYLVAPNTTAQRLKHISSVAGGFIYAVALKGVTGAANLDTALVERQVASIRQVSQLPVAVGFGVRDPQGAAAVARVADGVIVGSALVQMIADHGEAADLAYHLRDAAAALRRGMAVTAQTGGSL